MNVFKINLKFILMKIFFKDAIVMMSTTEIMTMFIIVFLNLFF